MKKVFSIKKFIFFVVTVFLFNVFAIAAPLSVYATNVTYYVDSVNGSDSNNGTSTSTAWRTLSKVNSTTFSAGDQILFNRGQTFEGMLSPLGSGSGSGYITIDAYGTGNRPIINGGTNIACIKLVDQSYWRIQNIEATGGSVFGIYAGVSGNSQTINCIFITGCNVHDVGGSVTSSYDVQKGCIVVCAMWPYDSTTGLGTTATTGSTANYIYIDSCTAADTTGFGGIVVSGASWGGSARGTSIGITNSTVSNTMGNGILVMYATGSYIQNCVAHDCGNDTTGNAGTPAAVWFYTSTSSTISGCEAYNQKSPGIDGGGFDLDTASNGCVVQYSYAHDNQTYGQLIYSGLETTYLASSFYTNINSVIRYNIFSYNGKGGTTSDFVGAGDIALFCYNGGTINGVKIYNNTEYWHPVVEAPALCDNYGIINGYNVSASYTGSNTKLFKNNIIYSDTTNGKMMNIQKGKLTLDYNIYYNSATTNPVFIYDGTSYSGFTAYKSASKQDSHSKNADPLLTSGTYHSAGMPSTQFSLQSGSPAVNAGTTISSNGSRDFVGTVVPQNSSYDIGAMESPY
jgi:hypothetical protein